MQGHLQDVRQGLLLGERGSGKLLLHAQAGLELDGNRKELISPQQLQRNLAFWIESDYNRERRNSTMG